MERKKKPRYAIRKSSIRPGKLISSLPPKDKQYNSLKLFKATNVNYFFCSNLEPEFNERKAI